MRFRSIVFPRDLGLLIPLLALLVLSPRALAQSGGGLPQDSVYSANATISYGSSFTPSYGGGDGTGAWQFAVSGYTTDTMGDTSDAGTYYSSNWNSSWTPPAPGTYYFTVVNDGDDNWAPSNQSSSYTLTVTQESQASVSSSNASITYGSSFTPSYSGGSGTGGWQFCISGYTGWQTSAWTPSGAGSYTFYIENVGDTDYAAATAGPYTLTVNKAGQASVSSSDATIYYDGYTLSYPSFTPSFSGGSGTGGWQFCVAGYTNWDVGASTYTGTNMNPNDSPGDWVSSWTPTASGTYSFSIARDEDTNYDPSSAPEYTLTVVGPANGVQWNSLGLPSSGTAYQTISFTANVTNNGTAYWGSNYYIELQDSSGTDEYDASVNGVGEGGSISPTFTLTLPGTPGTYTYQIVGLQSGTGTFGTPYTQSITVNPLSAPVITSSLSASGTYNSPFSYTITATNYPTGYGATGLPPGLSVNTSTGVISGTPTEAGTWTVTISATNDSATSPASLVVTINPISTTFSASPTAFIYDGSSQGPTLTVSPGGATYSVTGASAAAEGSYTLTATATGNYSGSATFAWSISPGEPGAFAVASDSPSLVKLAWSASTSGAGGVSYQVFTGSGASVGTTSGTSYTVTGFTPGSSYSYYVVAHDASGVASPATSTVSGTTASSSLSATDIDALLGISGSPYSETGPGNLKFNVLCPSQ